MATQSSRRNPVLIGLAVLTLAAVVWFAVGPLKRMVAPRRAAQPAPAVSVTSAQVKREDVPIGLSGVGTVQAMATVTVKPRVDGQLDRVGFVEGQDVKAGQLLAQIDPRTFQAQLQQAMAQKARDEAQLANARLDLQRYEGLIKENATTQQTLDTQRAQVAQLAAAVKTDEALVNVARVQLDYTTITAPLSGRVGARLVDPGNIVHAADANGLVVIRQIDPIDVVFTLPDGEFQRINGAMQASGAPLVVQASERASGQLLGQGKLILLNNTIDTTSGTIQLKGRFPNPSHTLWPGQYVNARLVLGERDQALTIPAAAVQRGQSGTYVYVVQADHTVASRAIEVAETQDAKAVVAKGLAVDERVVVDGQYKLKPGTRVNETAAATTIADAGAAPASAPAAGAPADHAGNARP
ncbi:efflux RND transporter periplasmic adaptor subunit [Cupriavidus basilensis]|uniref:efflux RND transporter periplasmic adaptor subunit n=1 Tax=Cupriavidus basilensis TaxID=68895 RepID=UPI00283BECF5|nr:efflux RND transporter periplasmic adaptor subunit [Cupriavidus basilensis]MDR3384721.1 efflux RND transporter periplasmic adaptor subunit [Cupriavidus basilensis]